jgi:fumarate reductase flavoprotein subunit
MSTRRILSTDVLVIGGGLAGERAALAASTAGHRVMILSLVPPRRSHSCAAQGGMQAALGNCFMGDGDDPTTHYVDTIRGSDWGADQEVVRMFAEAAPIAVRELAHWGMPWTRVRGGSNTYFIKGHQAEVEEDTANDGLIMHRDFGGTAKWRTCYAGAGTGHAALYALDSEVLRHGIEIRDRVEAVDLIHDGERCWGAVVRCLRTGDHFAVLSRATVIATGGFGRIYGQYTTNATINEGMGAAIALDTGVVPLANMEAIQFHPTTLFPSGILITEGCRGDGGHLLDKDLHRFMVDLEPEKQELASRDVVSRHMMHRIRDGYGVETPYGRHLWLDIRHLGEQHLTTKLREVFEICRDFGGLNPVTDLIPVRPTQHYSMGGIRVNKDGQAYSMAGLFAVGEAACWDMHGFNRLGGNSLAETVVSGGLVGANVADFAAGRDIAASAALAAEAVAAAEARADEWLARQGDGPGVFEIRDAMGEIMMQHVGIFRNGEDLGKAAAGLESLLQEVDRSVLRSTAPGMNPELTFALRLKRMLRLALTVTLGALARSESRGAHFRTDHPERNDREWLNRTLVRWPADDDRPVFDYEPVGLLDLPPGDRGYGRAVILRMAETTDAHNAIVATKQADAGRLASREPVGSEIHWGDWDRETSSGESSA